MKRKILIAMLTAVVLVAGCGSSDLDGNTTIDAIENKFEELTDKLEDKIETEKEASKNDNSNSSSENSSGNASTGSSAGLPEVISTLDSDNGDKLILVNKQYTVSENFVPIDLVAIPGHLSTNQGISIKSETYNAYLAMLADANAAGHEIKICSAYRSYSLQTSLYNNYVANYGVDYANKISAYPGRSEHHTGWALDITSKSMGYGLSQSFINTPEGQWINENCANYGFIIRYPANKTDITGYMYEPWHIRYVGVDAAKDIMARGITLEEYLGKA